MSIESFAVPGVIGIVVLVALARGVPVFDVFIGGAGEGLQTAVKILPSLVALIVSVGIFKASGALDMICLALEPVAALLSVPSEVIPLTLLRPISGSGRLWSLTTLFRAMDRTAI